MSMKWIKDQIEDLEMISMFLIEKEIYLLLEFIEGEEEVTEDSREDLIKVEEWEEWDLVEMILKIEADLLNSEVIEEECEDLLEVEVKWDLVTNMKRKVSYLKRKKKNFMNSEEI